MVAQREDVEHRAAARRSEAPLSGTLRTRPTAPLECLSVAKFWAFGNRLAAGGSSLTRLGEVLLSTTP
jgi:hypothetical protein